jgi:hypothetical protein
MKLRLLIDGVFNFMEEIFKDVPCYEGLYQVSNLGNVKSLPRKVYNYTNFYISKENILKPYLTGKKRKYKVVDLYRSSKRNCSRVHQLVAITFLGHKIDGHKLVIDHINNNPLDNRVDNLQIITNRENVSKDIKNASSKYTGVYWHKKANKWMSLIQINKKSNYLGLFKTEEEASLCYQNKLKELC